MAFLTEYDWRCLCGTRNACNTLTCMHCSKQRWSHLGIARTYALNLLSRILPERAQALF